MQEKFQSRIQDLSKARMAEAAQLKQLRDELQAATSAGAKEDIVKQHANELRQLEDRLTTKHQEELKVALDAAKASAPALSADSQAAVNAAIAQFKEEMKEEHAKAIEDALERGRKESAARAKIKDQQLVKAQTRLKELEARLLQQDGGAAPATPTPASTSTSASAPAVPATPTTPTTALPAAAPAPPKTGMPAGLPAKPTSALPTPATASAGPGRGRGRGGPARGLSIRGAAPGMGRGAAAAAVADAAAANASGAVKRTREGDVVVDDSVAKRQKQEGGGTGPVPIRRNRVQPPT